MNVASQVVKFPASSVTVSVTVCAPRPTVVPAAGLCVTVRLGSQLSVATTPPVKSGTSASQEASAAADWSPAQVTISGSVWSETVRVNPQVFELPESSVTENEMGVSPRERIVPGEGVWTMSRAESQASKATTPAVKSGSV